MSQQFPSPSRWPSLPLCYLLYVTLLVSILVASTATAVAEQAGSADEVPAVSSPLRGFPASITPSSGLILVLGSDGLIGSAVTDWLHAHHYRTLLVHNRSHVDLRIEGSLTAHLASLHIQPAQLAFAFFLACEVGGSKFLQSASTTTQSAILTHNLAIYHTVLPFLATHHIPFLFTSSYLSHMNTAYGAIKRTGEQLTRYGGETPLGRIVRLWNIWGRERVGGKSHVLTDWVVGCVAGGGVRSMSDGWEWRQFLHANDTAAALGGMMERWQHLPLVTDLSSAQWVQMRDVAQLVAAGQSTWRSGRTCSTSFSDRAEGSGGEEIRERLSPDTASWWWQHSGWRPAVTMEAGIADLYRFYGGQLEGEGVGSGGGGGEVGAVGWAGGVSVMLDACSSNDSRLWVYPTSSAPPFTPRSTDVTVDGSAGH